MSKNTALLAIFLILAACETPSQNVYDFTESGRSVIVDFGTILDKRMVKIKGRNSGAGAATGGVIGGTAGAQVGSGDGQIAGAAAGVLVGALAGAAAEQQLQDAEGIEYTVVTQQGDTMTIVQNYKEDEPVIEVGERVMVQTSGSYQRVLPADHLPEKVQRPKGIEVVD